MNRRDPISIKVTYTDNNAILVEKEFRSLTQASKFLTITPQTLKELSLGGKPKLHENVPKDLKVERTDNLEKIPEEFRSQKNLTDSKWHCDICNKDMKYKSKYAHMITLGHKKKQEMINKNMN